VLVRESVQLIERECLVAVNQRFFSARAIDPQAERIPENDNLVRHSENSPSIFSIIARMAAAAPMNWSCDCIFCPICSSVSGPAPGSISATASASYSLASCAAHSGDRASGAGHAFAQHCCPDERRFVC
jgi:hypothetical protein